LIYGGVCRGVNDELGLNLSYCPADVRRIRQIQLIVAKRNEFTQLGQETQEFRANLAILSGQQDPRPHFS
jgi:hypothetical protein